MKIALSNESIRLWVVILIVASQASAAVCAHSAVESSSKPDEENTRLRVIVETDAGGDPDDEQSMVRFLLYSNEWDVEGIICARPKAANSENLNSVRTGLGIVERMVNAYGDCYPNLVQHDARYPRPKTLLQRTVAGYVESDEGVDLIINAVDSDDPRPVWFMNWGTNYGSARSSLERALDRILKERGLAGYATFKNRLRLSSYKNFGMHETLIRPPFKLWVNTYLPNVAFPGVKEKRWYRRFGPLTATAGGFDLRRDVLTNHGPLGAIYPTNTDIVQKEGDTMTFLYLVPTGMNDPEQPTWGSWAGRHARNVENYMGMPYYWASAKDSWQGVNHRESSLKRWAVHIQNDFRSRMDWCVTGYQGANHPPVARVKGTLRRTVAPGDLVTVDASDTSDPDGNDLRFEWIVYPEADSYRGVPPALLGATTSHASFTAPKVDSARTIHLLLIVTDDGVPALTRYQRVIVTVDPQAAPSLIQDN